MSATRKPGRNFLFVPGPTNIPDRILRAMHIAMEDHRSSDFPKLTLPLYERLKRIFKTKEGQVVIFPSSGTGAWEAALTNTLAAGRQGSDRPFRPVQPFVGRACQAPWPRRHRAGRGVGHRRQSRTHRGGAARRQEPRDQGRARGAQRDGHRRHQQYRRGAPRAWTPPSIRRCFMSTASPRSRASTSASTSGASTSPSPARRRASCFRPASASSAPAKRRSRR